MDMFFCSRTIGVNWSHFRRHGAKKYTFSPKWIEILYVLSSGRIEVGLPRRYRVSCKTKAKQNVILLSTMQQLTKQPKSPKSVCTIWSYEWRRYEGSNASSIIGPNPDTCATNLNVETGRVPIIERCHVWQHVDRNMRNSRKICIICSASMPETHLIYRQMWRMRRVRYRHWFITFTMFIYSIQVTASA